MVKDETIKELKIRQSAEIKSAKQQFNQDWFSFIKEELQGENQVYYLLKLEKETIDVLLNMQYQNISHKTYTMNESYDYDEIHLKVQYKGSEHSISMYFYPGVPDSDDENERLDYYEMKNPFFSNEEDDNISDIFTKFNLAKKTLNFNNLNESLLDEYMAKEAELLRENEE